MPDATGKTLFAIDRELWDRTNEIMNRYLKALRDIAEWDVPSTESRQGRALAMRRIAREAING